MSDAATAAPGDNGSSTSAALAGATPAATPAAQPATPSAPAATPAAPSATPAATPAPSWFDGADELTTGFIQNKGWQNPLEAVKSYQNLEKLIGADRAGNTVVLPKADATPEEKSAFFEKLGRPSAPDGYAVKFGTDEATKNVQAKFHELGLTKAQGEAIAQWYEQLGAKGNEQIAAQKVAAYHADNEALKQAWGAAYDQNFMAARATVNALGLNGETIDKISDAIGHKATMELLAKIGSKTGEADFVSGDVQNFNGAMTPAQAKDQIRQLMADKEFGKQYNAKQAEAVQKMANLHKWAYPES